MGIAAGARGADLILRGYLEIVYLGCGVVNGNW